MYKTNERMRRFARLAMTASTVVAWATTADAYTVKKTPGGEDVRWEASDVTFHLDASVERLDGAAGAIQAAAKAWSGLDGAPTIGVETGGGGAAPGNDGVNTIFYAPEGSEIAGGSLAVTVLTFDDTGKIVDADIIINGRYSFAVLPEGTVPKEGAAPFSNEGGGTSGGSDAGAEHSDSLALHTEASLGSAPFDLQHVLAHELGHSLGLADETSNPSALMYLYTFPGDASRRAPSTDDSAGISLDYAGGASTHSAGCGATVSPRGPSRGAAWFGWGLALGVAAWARRRRCGR